MVPENDKARLLRARAVAASKRARSPQAPDAVEDVPGSDLPIGRATSSKQPQDVGAMLPLQAREVPIDQEPRAHTTCKRCAADVPADAVECWNCGLRFR